MLAGRKAKRGRNLKWVPKLGARPDPAYLSYIGLLLLGITKGKNGKLGEKRRDSREIL